MQQAAVGSRTALHTAGRVDAISAPELLESYEMAAGRGGFKEVCVAADEAMYMSSSGQRVLRMILQDCRAKKIPVQCDSALLSDRGLKHGCFLSAASDDKKTK